MVNILYLPDDCLTYIISYIDEDIFLLSQTCRKLRNIISSSLFGKYYLHTRLLRLGIVEQTKIILPEDDNIWSDIYYYQPHHQQLLQSISRSIDYNGPESLSRTLTGNNSLFLQQWDDDLKCNFDISSDPLVTIKTYSTRENFPALKISYKKTSTFLPSLYCYFLTGNYDDIHSLLDRHLVTKRYQGRLLFLILHTCRDNINISQKEIIYRLCNNSCYMSGKDVERLIQDAIDEEYSEGRIASLLRLTSFKMSYLPRIIPLLLTSNHYLVVGSLLKNYNYSEEFIEKIRRSFQ